MENIQHIESKKLFCEVAGQTGDTFKMSVFELSRWLSLLESVEIIELGAKRMKISLDNDDWIQPIAIEKYIKEKSGDIIDILMQDEDFLTTTTI